MNGKLLLKGRIESYPFRVPMSWSSRMGIMKTGAKVSLAVARYAKIGGLRRGEDEATRQQRVYNFMNDRSFADYIGDLSEDVEALFKPTATRSSAGLDEISAGAGVGHVSLVWNIGAGLSQSIVGGPSTLTESIAAAVDGREPLNSTRDASRHKKDSVA